MDPPVSQFTTAARIEGSETGPLYGSNPEAVNRCDAGGDLPLGGWRPCR